MGVGSLFYALLITATIYKFMTNIKSSQRLDFKWYLPVTESLLFVILGFMSCCTTKWDCPLSPWRALAGDLKHATETEAHSDWDAGNATSGLQFLVFLGVIALDLESQGGVDITLGQINFLPGVNCFDFVPLWGISPFARSRHRDGLLDKAA